MCVRCLFSAPLELTFTPKTGYRVWLPGLPPTGVASTLDEAFDEFFGDLVLWTDWFEQEFPSDHAPTQAPVDPRVALAALRPHLRRQICEPV